ATNSRSAADAIAAVGATKNTVKAKTVLRMGLLRVGYPQETLNSRVSSQQANKSMDERLSTDVRLGGPEKAVVPCFDTTRSQDLMRTGNRSVLCRMSARSALGIFTE